MTTSRFAVLGDPIEHSLSPTLHRAGHRALVIDATYEAIRVPAGGLAEFVAARGPQWRGFSVTAPLKREALAYADTHTDLARLAGGANTLVRTAEGWHADNTDVPGAVAAIRERYDAPLRSATILGGGATAASVGLALAEIGVSTLTLAARSAANAEQALTAIRSHPSRPAVEVTGLTDVDSSGDALVSTIPAAAQDGDLLARVLPAAVVFEVTYGDWPTPLARAAQEHGAAVVSGLDLLVHQAVLQFAMFTGHAAPLTVMRDAGEEALAARERGDGGR